MSDQSEFTQTTLEQDLKSYEEFLKNDYLTDVTGDRCDLLRKFVGHAIRLQAENNDLIELLTETPEQTDQSQGPVAG